MARTAVKTESRTGAFSALMGVGTAIMKASLGSGCIETFNAPVEIAFAVHSFGTGNALSLIVATRFLQRTGSPLCRITL
jgi:hypothetical protein